MYNQYAYYAESNDNNSNTKVLAKTEQEARELAAQSMDTYAADVELRCLGFGKVGRNGIIEVL